MPPFEFNELLLSNSAFLKPFAITLTKDTETAKDLYQQTLYKAIANREKYNTGTNVKAWLFTIMRNIFINDYRRRTRQQFIFDGALNDHLINHNQVAVTNSAEGELRLKEIKTVIYNLPKIFKIPFLLYFEGYKYHEISLLLHEPLGTVKSRIHFARKLLKEQIARY